MATDSNWKNKLWFGDNLEVLRDRDNFPNGFVDLIYLDPPFNSNATYNMLFKEATGDKSQAQIEAFEDTWQWIPGQTDAVYKELTRDPDYPDLGNLIESFEKFLGRNALMAYLVMMSIRLKELHRVLKSTGSLYLHCDPTASHYIKLVLDAVFGVENYRNEIVWLRSKNAKGSQFDAKKFGKATDTIFFYTKTVNHTIKIKDLYRKLTNEELFEKYDRKDEKGRFTDGPIERSESMGTRPNLVFEYKGYTPGNYGWRVTKDKLIEIDKKGDLGWTKNGKPFRKLRIEDDQGEVVDSFWGDIAPVNPQAAERLGYPTQKPEALLERIIKASSNEGDLVLDPFCGCGTTIAVAERLKRHWIGIDITWLSVDLMERRLKDTFGSELSPYVVEGAPKDVASAINLAERDKYQFQWWAVTLIGARPYQGKKKGSDTGIDGVMYFEDDMTSGKQEKIMVQVKAGKHVGSPHIRDLIGVLDREKAAIGVYISIEKPTKDMIEEARKAGVFESVNGKMYPRIQMLTIEEVMHGKQPDYPYRDTGGFTPFKRAARQEKDKGDQGKLFDK